MVGFTLRVDFIVVYCRTIRSGAALALGKLSALSTRVDPLVSDLLSSLQVIFVPFSICFSCLNIACYQWFMLYGWLVRLPMGV